MIAQGPRPRHRTATALLALIGTLAACGDRDCSLEVVADEFVDTTEYLDCGTPNDDATYRSAHDCVVGATIARQTFVVRWYRQGIEGVYRHAYAGIARDGDYELAEFVQSYAVDATVLPTVTYRCSELIDKGTCNQSSADLCLDCVTDDAITCQP